MWLIMDGRVRWDINRAVLIGSFKTKAGAEYALQHEYKGYDYVTVPTDDEPEALTWIPPGGVGWPTKGKSSQPEVPS